MIAAIEATAVAVVNPNRATVVAIPRQVGHAAATRAVPALEGAILVVPGREGVSTADRARVGVTLAAAAVRRRHRERRRARRRRRAPRQRVPSRGIVNRNTANGKAIVAQRRQVGGMSPRQHRQAARQPHQPQASVTGAAVLINVAQVRIVITVGRIATADHPTTGPALSMNATATATDRAIAMIAAAETAAIATVTTGMTVIVISAAITAVIDIAISADTRIRGEPIAPGHTGTLVFPIAGGIIPMAMGHGRDMATGVRPTDYSTTIRATRPLGGYSPASDGIIIRHLMSAIAMWCHRTFIDMDGVIPK